MLAKMIAGRILSPQFCSSSKKVGLPDLKYGYSALEPVLSSKLLETHHKKHIRPM